MTIEELTEIASTFLRDNYAMDLDIPIVRNNRLRTVMGRFISAYRGGATRIEIAGFVIEHGDRGIIIDTLYHECIHYALFERGEPNDDGHPHFESELREHSVGSSGINRVGPYIEYTCSDCGKEAQARGRRLLRDYRDRVTFCCGASIEIVGERIYNGTEAV
ncbi:SprT-like domain-containing protein [Sporosarcina psychrophila]|uniref:SprT family Zn-dependent metalloprotease n=1 Tax=Sporosarcina psychrophila TaxID=1476 RepID=A0ABV2KCU5_SPOPS